MDGYCGSSVFVARFWKCWKLTKISVVSLKKVIFVISLKASRQKQLYFFKTKKEKLTFLTKHCRIVCNFKLLSVGSH